MKWTIMFLGLFSFFVLLGCFRDSLKSVSAEILASYHDFLPLIQKARVSTPTPTPTQTPTSQPTQAPTPLPEGVYVLPNYSFFLTPGDSFHVVGEILNNTSQNIESVKVSVDVFDAYGALVATGFTYTYLSDLPAQERTCFDIFFLDAPAGWSSFQFETSYLDTGDPLPSLTVLNDSGQYDASSGDYSILGQVRNDQGSLVESVTPVGTLYGGISTVLGCGYTEVNSIDLEPGEESAFQIDYSDRDYAGVTSYRIQVDGIIASRAAED